MTISSEHHSHRWVVCQKCRTKRDKEICGGKSCELVGCKFDAENSHKSAFVLKHISDGKRIYVKAHSEKTIYEL